MMIQSLLAPVPPPRILIRKVALAFVAWYGLLCAVDVVALYAYYLRCALALGYLPTHDAHELPPAFMGQLHPLETFIAVLAWGFPVYVVAHGGLLLTHNISKRATAALVAVMFFLIFSTLVFPIGQWVYD